MVSSSVSIRRWYARGFWSIADQGLFAATNLVLNLLLAVWLTPAEYGAYALVYAMFLLLSTIHNGLLVEPMLVFGPEKYSGRFSSYVGTLCVFCVVLGLAIGATFLVGGRVSALIGEADIAMASVGIAVSATPILLYWLLRRASYVRFQPTDSVQAGALYMMVNLVGVIGLRSLDQLSPTSVLLLMGLSSSASALLLALKYRVRVVRARAAYDYLIEHLRYGRWAVATSVLAYVPVYGAYYVLPLLGGLESVGTLRAAYNIVTPATQTVTALQVFLLPVLVQAVRENQLMLRVRQASSAVLILTLVHLLFIIVVGPQLIAFLYVDKYENIEGLVIMLALLPIVGGISGVLSGVVLALREPKRVFLAHMIAAMVMIVLGIPSLVIGGVNGAAVAMLLSSVACAVVLGYQFSAVTTPHRGGRGPQ